MAVSDSHHSMRGFFSDTSGSLAVAIASAALLGVAGVAVDYGRGLAVRTQVQAALDAAVLSAIVTGSEAKAKRALKRYFAANARKYPTKIKLSGSEWRETSGSFTLSVAAEVDVPTTFTRVLGITSKKWGARSEAAIARRVDEIRITPERAQGHYPKLVEFRVKRTGQQSEEVVGTVDYMPQTHNNHGQGVMTVSDPGWISLTDVERIVLQLNVKSTSSLNPSVIAGMPYTYAFRTDEPEQSHYLFVEGQQMPRGEALPNYRLLPCDYGKVQHVWEDGGNFDQQDFAYSVEIRCGGVMGTSARLTR